MGGWVGARARQGPLLNLFLPRPKSTRRPQRKNPLKNLNVMLRLNPYMKTYRRHAILQAMRNKAVKEKAKEAKDQKEAKKGPK